MTKSSFKSTARYLAIGASGAIWVCPAAAQTNPPATPPVATDPAAPAPVQEAQSAPDDGVQDIMVYGQRRSRGETAQRVPIAITAVDETTLQATNSVSLADIGSLAPSVQTAPIGIFPGFPNFSIRGIGVNSSIRSVDPAINILQDGMVLGFQAGAVVTTFDLETVEVLRGPQGVLFGRNATGGALALRTRRPDNELGARFDVSYGNFNELNANASIEGPLGSPNILGKIAVLYRTNTGTIENTNDGIFVPARFNPTGARSTHSEKNVGDVSELVIKPTMSFRLSDATRLTLFGQYQRYDDDGTIPRNFGTPAGRPRTQSELDYGYTPTTSGYRTNIGDPGYLKLTAGHVVAELENEIGAGLLTTVAAWRKVAYDSSSNLSGTPFLGFIYRDNVERSEQYSLETRYNVPVFQDVELTAGLFYFHLDIDVIEKRQTAGPVGAAVPNVFIRGQFDQQTDAYAGFANVDWAISDTLKASVGARYSSERKSIDYTPLLRCGQNFTACPGQRLATAERWNDLSPRAVLSWQAADRILLFGSYTAGFRSGNFNPRTTATTLIGVGPADPESVDTFEIGAKTDLFDRKVRLNVGLYQSNYSDIQQVLTVPGNAVVQTLLNGADARIRGAEAELTVRPSRAFEFQSNIGYTNAKYRQFDIAIPESPNPTALKFPKIPEVTFYAAGTYTVDVVPLDAELSLRVAYDWRSQFETNFLNTPELAQEAYGLTNANLTLDLGRSTVSLFARNLFDVYYTELKTRTFAYSDYGGAPRTYGIRITHQM